MCTLPLQSYIARHTLRANNKIGKKIKYMSQIIKVCATLVTVYSLVSTLLQNCLAKNFNKHGNI